MQVNQILEMSAQKYPDSKAVYNDEKWMTYREIDSLSNKVCNTLIEGGIKRGDRVALLYENSFDYVIGYYAILKAGAITVALNTASNKEKLIYYINDSGAKGIISNQRFSKILLPALSQSPHLNLCIINQEDLSEYQEIGHCHSICLKDIYRNGNHSHPNVRSIDMDVASIVYTSGSTGKPKGVTLTHLNILSNTRSIVDYLKLTSKDRIMVVLPFYYIYGKSLLNTHFYTGGSVVIENRFAYPQVVLDTLKNTQATGFAGVPSTFIILLNKTTIREYQFNHLRYITQAGGSMAVSVQKEVDKVLSPAKLVVMYGATEASARLSYLDPEMLHKKWGSIGKAIPNVDLFVANERGEKAGPEEIGEIVARGSNIMAGYWNDPVETDKVLKNGCYFTGDLGKTDEEGFLYVVGRKKDIIKVAGERVSAKEIEECILEMNQVHETAVIGIPDDIVGEAIKAFIVPRKNATFTEEDYKKYLKKKLPSYMQPKTIVLLDDLPKNDSGKILKEKLKNP
ncbi:AMP-binding protein [candidate division KSB1 bacterium]|nr:AMP-binding protein [candidate division KSB1 bacterium]